MEKAKRMKMIEERPERSLSKEAVDSLAKLIKKEVVAFVDKIIKKGVANFAGITTRRIKLSDVDDLMKWATDDEVRCFCTWYTHTSRDQAIDYIKNEAIPRPRLELIYIKDRAIGVISVTQNSGNYDKCRAELEYCLARKYWIIEIVAGILKMVIPTIFREWPDLERLEAKVEVNNMASQKVLEKARFQREGVLRKYRILEGRTVDFALYSILSSDIRVDLSLV